MLIHLEGADVVLKHFGTKNRTVIENERVEYNSTHFLARSGIDLGRTSYINFNFYEGTYSSKCQSLREGVGRRFAKNNKSYWVKLNVGKVKDGLEKIYDVNNVKGAGVVVIHDGGTQSPHTFIAPIPDAPDHLAPSRTDMIAYLLSEKLVDLIEGEIPTI